MFAHWQMVKVGSVVGAVWAETLTYGSARGSRCNSAGLLTRTSEFTVRKYCGVRTNVYGE